MVSKKIIIVLIILIILFVGVIILNVFDFKNSSNKTKDLDDSQGSFGLVIELSGASGTENG